MDTTSRTRAEARYTVAMRGALLVTLVVSAACAPASKAPPCGTPVVGPKTLIPGPGQEGYDEALGRAARRHDRQFHALNAWATGLAAELRVDAAARADVSRFLDEGDGFDFEAATGRPVAAVGAWSKSAGLYGGVGIAADAMRYAVLRDTGAACDEVKTARSQLVRSLDALHVASRIDGVAGPMARSLLRVDLPTDDAPALTPLRDEQGRPLPIDKNNGTWRADQTGEFPQFAWEDSMSRDMLVGWVMAAAIAAEVLEGDEALPPHLLPRLRADARETGVMLMTRAASGYDLELQDADGRPTFHATLNENSVDRVYVDGAQNGFYALMALGIVGALAKASGDEGLSRYLAEDLLGPRRLDRLAAASAHLVDMGTASNYSGYNMGFTAGLLAQRFVPQATANGLVRRAIREELYDRPDNPARQPKETKQTLFDLIAAAALAADGREGWAEAVSRGTATLVEFPAAPLWNVVRVNCDDAEVRSQQCTLDDGTTVGVLGDVGRNDDLVADRPIPMRVRPLSNYFWRSNPYRPNDSATSGGDVLLSGVDFRVAYWLGRWLRAP